MNRFSDKLSDIDWTDTVNSADVNDSFKSFFKVFVKLYDECFLPLAVTRTKQLTARKPWITQVILTSINKKNRFYRDYLKKNTPHETVKYKKYINKLTKIIKAAENLTIFENFIL